ncbi:hypothetical protein EMPS_03719 [Entomortierella parvispora]|uniref:Uncharacterized protein n=1 Tax=Entomortierella parvispora TaxID=205924 RepID=A0A9P3H748_9FUNG|nr:hypothetical protein EMPS_03719 [Entomortierella parvispora]
MEGVQGILTQPSTEEALRLPEVLACILSYLANDRRALRSVRLVSRQFNTTANRFFRIHLNANYALEHHCIQEAASIIGGLSVTFPEVDFQSANRNNETPEQPTEPRCIDTAFCSLVAQTCINLETLKIVLEGPYSERVPLFFSALLSQDLERPAVFCIKELQVMLSNNCAQSFTYRVSQAQFLGAITKLSGAGPQYAPHESSLARLEKLTLKTSFLRNNSDLYKILQFKICPEVAIATSFLGPVFIPNATEDSLLPESLRDPTKPSRTLKVLECSATGFSVDQIYRLKEQAPALEELRIWEISNAVGAGSVSEAIAHANAERAGSLNLKQLRLVNATGRNVKLLLGRLLNPTALKSFHVNYIYPHRLTLPEGGNELPGGILRDIMEEMRRDQFSGSPHWGSMQEFGIGSFDREIDPIDWLQELKTIPRLSRLENISLPLSVHEFLQMFDMPSLREAVTDPRVNTSPIAATAATPTISSGHEEVLLGSPSTLPQLPFPSCSTLISLTLNCAAAQTNEAGDGLRLANYLTRWLPQLKHLDIQESYFPDLTFLDVIAPPLKFLSRPRETKLLSSLQVGGQNSGDDSTGGLNRNDSHSSSVDVGSGHMGLCQLESLAVSFVFLTRDEFLGLPRSDHLLELLDKKSDLLARRLEYTRGPAGVLVYQNVEKLIRAEEQKMLLDARPIQVHEDRVDQILAFLDRFQKSSARGGGAKTSAATDQDDGGEISPAVSGLKKIKFTQEGMPNVYLRKLELQVESLYPEIEWRSASILHRIPEGR